MPEGVSLTIWQDDSKILQGRQDLLLRNGRTGFLLVFLVLAIFLRLRLAIWVSLGIPISFLGTLWLLPALGVSINLISLFAFIIVLGIVVDDAIVVGENIGKRLEDGVPGLEAAREGAREMAIPVTFAVLTSVAAFAPLLGVPGRIGQVMRVIPLIVIPTLLFSLVESLLILPSHLSHLKPSGAEGKVARVNQWWRLLQRKVGEGLGWAVERTYRPSLRFGIEWRYLTMAVFALLLFVTVGLVGRGAIKFVFFPNVEADYMVANVIMPLGTPVEVTERAVTALRESARQLREEYAARGEDPARHVLASVGDQPLRTAQSNTGPNASGADFSGSHLGEVAVELLPSEERSASSPELARRWRELTGPIPDALELTYSASIFRAGDPINVQLEGADTEELDAVARELKERLADYAGVFDIRDTYRQGKEEIKLQMKPGAEATGITLSDVARQVRQAFYGEEAQRVQRGRDDVKVMVRYPAGERRSVNDLEDMWIRTPDGSEVPLTSLATPVFGRGFASINRADRRRTISVTADVDTDQGNANEIVADLQERLLPELLAAHPGISYSFEGEQEQQRETMGGLLRGFAIALLAIYALMAIPFRSYFQPIVVMGAIPFGLVGAIGGHVVMGMNLTILSMFGIVALTGVVVNDSIVLLDQINRLRRNGASPREAVMEAGPLRFRAILLTSLTTVAGLTPIMLERSLQAQFLIPIAVSLAFGVLFATFITLILVPASYLAMEDFLGLFRRGKVQEEGRATAEHTI
jgi:multidrug efflux pump subunit AcrB